MANTLRLRRGSTTPTAGSFVEGEPAWDSTGKKLYVKAADGTMVQIGPSAGGSGTYTVSSTAPTSPANGDRWFDTNSGIEYTYVNDGNSSQWVETSAPGIGEQGPQGPAGTGDVIAANANAFTGANTFYNATGQTVGTATAANDGIVLQGRAGGTSTFRNTLVPGTLSANRTLTLPDTTGTVVTTGDTGTVTSTMIADGTIANADINASAAIATSKLASFTAGQVLLGNATGVPTATTLSGDITVNSSGVTAISAGVIVDAEIATNAAIAGTKISPAFGSQNISTSGTISGLLRPSAGTNVAGTAPLDFTAGTNLTVAEAGAVEYDGTFFYATPTTTSGRGSLQPRQTFRLTGVGGNIGGTIADFFGATSAINLAATSVYDIEFWPYFQKNTAGTVTWTLTASSAPNVISGSYTGSPVSGIAAGAPITGYAGSRAATTAAFGATASVTNNAFMAFSVRVQVFTNAATTFKLQVTCGAGTVTPQAGSFYTVRQVSGTTGSFA